MACGRGVDTPECVAGWKKIGEREDDFGGLSWLARAEVRFPPIRKHLHTCGLFLWCEVGRIRAAGCVC